MIKSLALLLITLLLVVKGIGQEPEMKYQQVIGYLKNNLGDTSFNVSPIIRPLGVGLFQEGMDCDSSLRSIVDSFFTDKNHRRQLYFQPYKVESIVKYAENAGIKERYVTFSRPVSNFLVAEMRRGNMNWTGLNTPYFGEALVYLFLFSSENKILKVYTSKAIYN
ncbi:hypothetical protein HB364_31150 [Pseudoflavitalea sp. X16]|uniref:hypothetical protein n=1 Tax=Paraflavitalea devenefica TaxID=2716334 RepID=UPI00141FF363|nr:hypothetical protein [Paraflavitalea devenefica]NII29577.1 hypothetical protein [Paraflavitalea devenefica]